MTDTEAQAWAEGLGGPALNVVLTTMAVGTLQLEPELQTAVLLEAARRLTPWGLR